MLLPRRPACSRAAGKDMPMALTDNPGGVSIVPELSVRRGRAAIEFYKAAFGAIEVYRVGGTADNPDVVAQLSVGDASFWVSDESPPNANFSPESVGGGTVRMLLIVDDPDSAVERAKAAGATEVYPVGEAHGWRLGRIEDPFGHHWEIGKPLIPWPPPDGLPHGNH
jgi:PhnB protein